MGPGPHHRNARKFSPSYASGNMELVSGKYEKQQPRPNRMRKEEKEADEPNPEKDTDQIFLRCHTKPLS